MFSTLVVMYCFHAVQSYQQSKKEFAVVDLKDDPHIIGNKIHEAATTFTWFYVINHDITEELSDNLWSESSLFFDWKLNEKLALSKNTTHYGYFSNNTEKHDYRFQSMPDLKEIFHVQNFRKGNESFAIQNQWPSTERLPNFKFVYKSEINELTRVALKLNEYFAMSLNLSATYFAQSGCFDSEGLNAAFRVIKYDRTASDVQQKVFGCGAHSDFDMFSLLYSNGVKGLQFKDENTNYWYDVPFVKNAYVVIVGNVLKRLSNEVYLPTTHRVAITDLDEARYSMVFFWTPKLKCLVQCLPAICNNETNISPIYEPIMYDEYITRKLQEIMEYASDYSADKSEL